MSSPLIARVVTLFAVVVALGVWPGAEQARADPGEAVTAFDADVVVDARGNLQVTETIGYRFAGTAHHGLVRKLRAAAVTAVRAESPTGAPAQTTATAGSGYTTIRVGDPAQTVGGTQTYVLHYALGGVLSGNALRWDFVGDGWDVPVQRASVRITAPRPAAERHCAASGCTDTSNGSTAAFAAGPLAPGNGLVVTLDYPAGTLPTGAQTPGLVGQVLGWLQLALVLGVLGGLGWWVSRLLRTTRSDADRPPHAHLMAVAAAPARAGRPTASAAQPAAPLEQTDLPVPPPDLRPGLLGVLHAEGAGTDAVTATLLDLAVRGHLRVEEQPGRRGPANWTLVRACAPDALLPHEAALLAAIPRPVTVTALCRHHTRALKALQEALVAVAVERGWATKNTVVSGGRAASTALFAAGFAGGVLSFLTHPFPYFFYCVGAGMVGALARAGFSAARPVRRSAAGDAVLAELAPYLAELGGLGLERVPPERAAEVFSRSLPHAVALGTGERWTRRFAALFAGAPRTGASWYVAAVPREAGLGAVTRNVVGFVTAAGERPSSSAHGGFASSGGSGFSATSVDGGGSSSSSGGGGSW